jgi:hypothetical protein
MEELLEYVSSKYRNDLITLVEQIKLIKSKKKIPPHIIEFEGEKIDLYDEIVKFVIEKKNAERTWFERNIRKVLYTPNNVLTDVKNLIGLDALSNIIVYRRVRRGKSLIKVVFIGSYMVLRNTYGGTEVSNATESDYVMAI